MEELQYRNDLLEAMNEKYLQSEKVYQEICDTMDQAILYYSFETDRIRLFGSTASYFDFPLSSRKDILQLLNLIDDEGVPMLKEALFLEKTQEKEKKIVCKSTVENEFYEFEVELIFDKKIEPIAKIIKVRDITTYVKQERALEYLAYFDALTGLSNRNHFLKHLNQWIFEAEENQSIISVLIFDINNFRKINDCGGMIFGDEIIVAFTKILNKYAKKNVIISRFHADIFYMAIKDPCGESSVENITGGIFEALRKPISLSSSKSTTISVCAGVVNYPDDTSNSLELLKYAEIALYKAQELGKNTHVYFNQTILDAFLFTEEAEGMLRQARINQDFYLNFQPQFDSRTKKLRGVEALLRWENMEGKIISPAVFIPMAEKSGMIIPLGKWVIEESLKTYMKWQKKYAYSMMLAINISAKQFYRGDIIIDIMNALKKYDMDPSLLEIEITESVMIHDLEGIINKMNILRSMGIKVSMDDFGTGYSSLAYLSKLPIDTLKIDKSFIDSVLENERTKIIIEAVLSTVKKLGIVTVAEGVETEEQFDFLKEKECDCIQGFWLGKPMYAEDIEQLIMKEI